MYPEHRSIAIADSVRLKGCYHHEHQQLAQLLHKTSIGRGERHRAAEWRRGWRVGGRENALLFVLFVKRMRYQWKIFHWQRLYLTGQWRLFRPDNSHVRYVRSAEAHLRCKSNADANRDFNYRDLLTVRRDRIANRLGSALPHASRHD